MANALYRSIEARYNLTLPGAYRSLEERGLLSISAPAHVSAFYEPGSYLWLNDMEWYSLRDIVNFRFQAWQLPGFVPFAFSGGGDYWCWQPAFADQQDVRVVCCFRDNEFATVYAPNFHTALYRQIIDLCCSPVDDDIDSSAFLRRWSMDLAGIFPALWCAKLRRLGDRPDHIDEAKKMKKLILFLIRRIPLFAGCILFSFSSISFPSFRLPLGGGLAPWPCLARTRARPDSVTVQLSPRITRPDRHATSTSKSSSRHQSRRDWGCLAGCRRWNYAEAI